MRLLIVGYAQPGQMGAYLSRAAETLGVPHDLLDMNEAEAGNRIVQSVFWRLRDRKPARLDQFSEKVVQHCKSHRPDVVVTTGVRVPLFRSHLESLRARHVRVVNYSTDDPWNPGLTSEWFLSSLPAYDTVFTPRRSNIEDFRRVGVRNVRYLPFGYDPEVHVRRPCSDPDSKSEPCDVQFVGGCDDERLPIIRALVQSGLKLALFGQYWNHDPVTRDHWRGVADQKTIVAASSNARICLCLVRRANRDGHVMRSFEAAAIGGCILAEDTDDHRDLFGPDAAVYFRTNEELVCRAQKLIGSAESRSRLATALAQRMSTRHDSYSDRLAEMLDGFAAGDPTSKDTATSDRSNVSVGSPGRG
jgi:spore maturation protein CgeB